MSKRLRVLLVSNDAKRTSIVEEALAEAGCFVLATVQPDENLQVLVEEGKIDAIVIFVHEPRLELFEQLRKIYQTSPCPVLFFTRKSSAECTRMAVELGISAYVIDGFQKERLRSILDLAMLRFGEYQQLRKELISARTALADRKIIERAKGFLMEKQRISENQAYKILRSIAMQRNQRLAEVARNIVAMNDVIQNMAVNEVN